VLQSMKIFVLNVTQIMGRLTRKPASVSARYISRYIDVAQCDTVVCTYFEFLLPNRPPKHVAN